MVSKNAGYSGTPLSKKLGIKAGDRIYTKNAPGRYDEIVSPLPDNVLILKRLANEIDVIHFFTKSEMELRSHIEGFAGRIKQNGMIWISWPKKASGVKTDITEDTVRSVVLPLGLVDVKVCAVDDIWSALKIVIRKENRK